ncbi:glycoside hydrolase family 38 C-terminal domain-containing protein [Nonomuraea jiangxiensis]|uniref:NPCBM-associated, NEW3 domain of alpha-galactosidase n=1 Tax=Nonomuraea jiangxiensis TaxID=633440 RepID=A0A1G8QC09_9ACTN|nr:glycoside hydrolase family 38 C-terminal domain-containing protein [Nonomuraea jiangxiensis]SDJ01995.1 NPCBM-associated, NEW3 domain of alpha-galactosidase [Nonomuraea jiangxiensis]
MLTIDAVESTELFVGHDDAPLQILRVTTSAPEGPIEVTVSGGAHGSVSGVPGTGVHEVPVSAAATPGTALGVTVRATGPSGTASATATLVVAEPGWTVHLVSHFHYDPVWWNTQAGYASQWDAQPEAQEVRMSFQFTAFQLIDAHLELARRDPDYRFVLAEVDYLKPYWDAVPENREIIRTLVAEGRLEIMGGTYNEPNTNLTGAETTIRNAVHGVGFQRDVLGGEPATAWQLDAFGHDPQFPGLMADAGLTSSAWARGPFHQWGPSLSMGTYDTPHGDPSGMQFRSEFEWISPSGRGLLTHYMAAHYSAGWSMDSAQSLEAAEESVYGLFLRMRKVAATRNVLVPVGTDYSPPNKWLTEIHRDWNSRYLWPRFVCALPRDFFAAVAAELTASGARLSPQTRDMNPVYTGKDVSYIDTKQAHRAAENELLDAERFAALACLAGDAAYPEAALDKAWRQLVFGAHHDALTGTESDQVYVDLLAGWREAFDLAREVHEGALRHLAARVPTGEHGAVVVFNALAWPRTDVVRAEVAAPFHGLLDENGDAVPAVVEGERGGRVRIAFLAGDVPSVGHRAYRLAPEGRCEGWRQGEGTAIANDRYRLTVDPARGGAVASLVDLATGEELITPGEIGNEIVVYDEYPEHPTYREGPWHLLPTGTSAGSAAAPATSVAVERSPLGERVTVTGSVGPLAYTQVITLWRGVDRVDCATHVDRFDGADKLVRLRWPCAVPGARPVSEVGHAVVGRSFAFPDVDTARHPWTLDNPAHQWFGLSSAARVALRTPDGGTVQHAIGVAEIVVPAEQDTAPLGRDLAVRLARSGVTATCTHAEGNRYGLLAFDSNLPDVRIAVGGPDDNAFTAALLEGADPRHRRELDRALAAGGPALLWVPAGRPAAETFHPDADLRGPGDLPVLVIAGADLREAVAAVVADLGDHVIEHVAEVTGREPGLADRTVAVLNRGVPGFAVDAEGRMHLSLMRSCTSWPSGMWIDPPRRTAPDGSAFQLQHWSHTFDYALAAGEGDWRRAGIVARAHDYNHPLRAVVQGPHDGPLPATASLVTVEPAGAAVLAAFKAAGNPIAHGRTRPSDPRQGVTARLYEPHGEEVSVRVSAAVPFGEAAVADVLEVAGPEAKIRDGVLHAELAPSEIATFVLRPREDGDLAGAGEPGMPLARAAEPAQPVYSRFWLHNRGSAPIGYQPLSVFAGHEGDGRLRVTLASDLTDADAEGEIRVIAPPGWDASPSDRPVRLGPGGWTAFDVDLAPPPDADPGPWPVAVRLETAGNSHEDVVFVDGQGRPAAGCDPGLLAVDVPAEGLTLSPGDRTTWTVRLRNLAGFGIRGEAQVISPWGTWNVVDTAVHAIEVPPGGEAELAVALDVPPDARPGEWWALVKCMWFGQVSYSPAVPLRIAEAAPARTGEAPSALPRTGEAG